MDLESSLELIQKAKTGDEAAIEQLLARYRPRLFRWASGRMPAYARDFTDTEDLIQVALLGLVRNFATFRYEGEWSLQAYLRRSVVNGIREQLRKRVRTPEMQELPVDLKARDQCPYEQAVGKEVFERYNRALEQLTAMEQEAVVAWVELGCSHREILLLTEKPSVDASRMFVSRALEKIATLMAANPDPIK